MSSKSSSMWWIIIIVLLLFVVAIGLSDIKSGNIETDKDELEKRREQEEKLLKELENLEKKQEIFEKHKFRMEFTDDYLEKLSEKRYSQFIRWGVVSIVLLTCFLAILIPAVTNLDLISWYGIGVLIFEICAAVIFVKISKAKEQIKDYIKLQIDGRIYGNRDNDYFKEKIGFYQSELVKIESSIDQKVGALKGFSSTNTKSLD